MHSVIVWAAVATEVSESSIVAIRQREVVPTDLMTSRDTMMANRTRLTQLQPPPQFGVAIKEF